MNLKLLDNKGDLFKDPTPYRRLIRKLNFFIHTRPDLSYTIHSQSVHAKSYNLSLESIATYLELHFYMWARYLFARGKQACITVLHRFWSGCMPQYQEIYYWLCSYAKKFPYQLEINKKHTVSRSSSKAEYRAITNTASEVVWLIRLLNDLGLSNLKPVTIHCDNQSAIHIAKNLVLHGRTNHIEVDCHFTKEKIVEGLLNLTYPPNQNQLADVLTKILPLVQSKPCKANQVFPNLTSRLRKVLEYEVLFQCTKQPLGLCTTSTEVLRCVARSPTVQSSIYMQCCIVLSCQGCKVSIIHVLFLMVSTCCIHEDWCFKKLCHVRQFWMFCSHVQFVR